MAPARTLPEETTASAVNGAYGAAASKQQQQQQQMEKPIDTGFPEPFSEERNTTLRHPSAIVARPFSPSNATAATEISSRISNEKARRMRFIPAHARHNHNHNTNGESMGEGLVLDDAELYRGLQERSASEIDGSGSGGKHAAGKGRRGSGHQHQGKVKRALHRLSCGSV